MIYIVSGILVIMVIVTIARKVSVMNNPNVKNVNSAEAKELISANKDMLILDVRTRDEYAQGHIPGAKLIPVNELPGKVASIEKYRDKPVLVYCASGGRSPSAVRTLLEEDFTKIYHLSRGFLSWR